MTEKEVKPLSWDIAYARAWMDAICPLLETYDEERDTVTILREHWQGLSLTLQIIQRQVQQMEEKLQPPDTSGPNIINLNLERQKRRNKQNERMKPL